MEKRSLSSDGGKPIPWVAVSCNVGQLLLKQMGGQISIVFGANFLNGISGPKILTSEIG